jgi:hypothetical protein
MHGVDRRPLRGDLVIRPDAGGERVADRLFGDVGRLADDETGVGALGIVLGGEPGISPSSSDRLRVIGAITMRLGSVRSPTAIEEKNEECIGVGYPGAVPKRLSGHRATALGVESRASWRREVACRPAG